MCRRSTSWTPRGCFATCASRPGASSWSRTKAARKMSPVSAPRAGRPPTAAASIPTATSFRASRSAFRSATSAGPRSGSSGRLRRRRSAICFRSSTTPTCRNVRRASWSASATDATVTTCSSAARASGSGATSGPAPSPARSAASTRSVQLEGADDGDGGHAPPLREADARAEQHLRRRHDHVLPGHQRHVQHLSACQLGQGPASQHDVVAAVSGRAALRPDARLLLLGARGWPEPAGDVELAAHASDPVDWTALVELATREGTAPLLHPHLWRLSLLDRLPEVARRRLTDVVGGVWAANAVLARGWAQATAALRQAGVETLTQKGMALANTVYEEPGLRPMADV